MLKIEGIKKRHTRDSFSCGNDDTDEWLRNYAGQSDRSKASRVQVLVNDGDSRVLGHYSQSAYRIDGDERTAIYSADRKPRYPIPAVLIGRLARCNSISGQGAGEVLLAHALRACTQVSEHIGLQMAVVHAIDDRAVSFYKRFGFIPFVDHPHTLMLPVKTLINDFPA